MSNTIIQTNEQKNIIESVFNHEILKINAFAGTGKTSTLQQLTSFYPNKKFLYLAYNKSIQIDAAGKFGKNTEVKTIHSLAYKYVISSTKLDLTNIKNHNAKDFANIFKTTDQEGKIILNNFTQYCNSSKIEHEFTNYSTYIQEIIEQIDTKKLPVSFDYFLKKFQLLLTMGLVTKSYDVIMIDEAQDSNDVTLDILKKLNSKHKIIIGDKHQQIYSFKESANIMNLLKAYELPLTQTFRFPKNIAHISNLLLEKYKDEKLKIYSNKEEVSFDEILKDESKTIGYISRGNSSLLSKMFEFSKNKIPYKTIRHPKEIFITIKDIGYFLNKNKFLISKENSFLKDFNTEDELVKYIEDTKNKQLKSSLMCYNLIFDSNIESVLQLEVEATEYFISKNSFKYFLTTAHTSKGLEFDGIEVADDFSDFGCLLYEMGYKTYQEFLDDKDKNKHPLLDEINLLYVAITRCKLSYSILSNNLQYIVDEKWKDNITKKLEFLALTQGCYE